jgi:hypothetical protein
MSNTNNEWQPIETAPKNEETIIVWDANVELALWDSVQEEWISLESSFFLSPSHWMPLPEPPKQEK